ncbi:alpha/beta hydrolase [Rhodoferax sp. GW822-FHT02A01]|uniref:alpha/beta hydrolase n=1 Tax=Rhodoferax sp. GW822-FHT02A01 TaxID=3141537 RepID=UPI00315D9C4C
MAKFKGHAPGYFSRVILSLSMRLEFEGGGLRDPGLPHWKNELTISQPDLVVLVHGFNNNQEEAEVAYLGFRDRQAELLQTNSQRFEDTLTDVFWPGDADWGFLDRLDALCYPKAVGVAKTSAPILADYLMSRTDVLNLYFIGHSMGCRVVLETIEILRSRGHQTPIRKVCLMAAAVPTHEICPGGQLSKAFEVPERLRVLFSPADLVLQYAFPLGESAGGDGLLPVAVGRYGDVPMSPGKIDRDWIPSAGHSDYWGWNNSKESKIAAQEIADFLSFGAQPNSLRSRPVAPARPEAPKRNLALRDIGYP